MQKSTPCTPARVDPRAPDVCDRSHDALEAQPEEVRGLGRGRCLGKRHCQSPEQLWVVFEGKHGIEALSPR